MNDLDEAMDEKLERLERENDQLRAGKQELIAALLPFITRAWITLQVMRFAREVFNKHKESMTYAPHTNPTARSA